MRPGKFLFYATMEQVESKLTHLIHQETLLQEFYMQVRLHLIFPTLNKSNKEDMAENYLFHNQWRHFKRKKCKLFSQWFL